jgi:hypothetical protein
MESPTIDVDFLAKETFALSEALKGREDFGQADFFEEVTPAPVMETIEEEIVDSAPFPVSTGLVFKIDNSSSTFCVRGIKTFNINETIHDLMCEDEKLLKRLKIRDKEELANVHYFETKSIEQAEIISEYIINRRFPVHEEMVCNLSDPGFSWWYEGTESGCKVYFKAQSVERDTDFIRLGPIGDRAIAANKLALCEGLFRKFFSIAEYSSTEKSFEVKAVNPQDANFLKFREIFERGQFNFELETTDLSLDHQRLVLFLEELAVVRGFWISVEDLLS